MERGGGGSKGGLKVRTPILGKTLPSLLFATNTLKNTEKEKSSNGGRKCQLSAQMPRSLGGKEGEGWEKNA